MVDFFSDALYSHRLIFFMQKFLNWLDQIAEIETEHLLPKWLERIAFIFLILMILSAPHSIAATQTAWLSGMFFWMIRLFIKPRRKLLKTPLDIALWAFLGWSAISSVFSYDPATSIDRLRNVALFLIFYFVINNLKTVRAVKFLASALIFSCMVNVLWTPIERIFGRGVEIHGMSAQSPLAKAFLKEGDTLLEADGKKLKTLDDLIALVEQSEITHVKFYRPDFYYTVEVKRANLLGGANTFEKLGVTDWKKSRNWRSAGFYGHYTTYAEVLQMIAALVFGLFVALDKKRSWRGAVLLFCLLGMTLALILTVTRASQLGFLAAAFAIVLINGNRKMLLTLALIALPLGAAALVFVQQSRQVGFFDQKDDSTVYRQTVYKEGFTLWTKDARNFFLGVGMDSIKRYAKEWRLFDDGKLPMGHFHSTPLQLLVERGLPALLLWLFVLLKYGKTLLNYLRVESQKLKSEIENRKSKIENRKSFDWQKKGVILGGFGSLVGFFTSGLVHFNLGDAEVAMVFFMLMGLSVSLVIQDSKSNIESVNLES
jgi:hypothetical protein